MTTVADVAHHISGLIGLDDMALLVGDWVAHRIQELVNSTTLRSQRRRGELIVPAAFSTGTVSVTSGSTTVTGVGTGWTGDLAGRHLRIGQPWYEISSINNATSLSLTSPYAEATASAQGYRIVQRRIRVAPLARKLGMFVHMRTRRALDWVSGEGLDLYIPSRFHLATVPQYVSEADRDADGTLRVEVYPFSTNTEVVHYLYWESLVLPKFNDPIPAFMDTEALREGVLVDVYRHLAAKAAAAHRIEEAALWRNESRAQLTAWEGTYKTRLFYMDSGADDLEFLLLRDPAHPQRGTRDITTAREAIWFT